AAELTNPLSLAWLRADAREPPAALHSRRLRPRAPDAHRRYRGLLPHIPVLHAARIDRRALQRPRLLDRLAGKSDGDVGTRQVVAAGPLKHRTELTKSRPASRARPG